MNVKGQEGIVLGVVNKSNKNVYLYEAAILVISNTEAATV